MLVGLHVSANELAVGSWGYHNGSAVTKQPAAEAGVILKARAHGMRTMEHNGGWGHGLIGSFRVHIGSLGSLFLMPPYRSGKPHGLYLTGTWSTISQLDVGKEACGCGAQWRSN